MAQFVWFVCRYTAREQLACDANSSPALPPFWGERDSAVKADIFSGWDFF